MKVAWINSHKQAVEFDHSIITETSLNVSNTLNHLIPCRSSVFIPPFIKGLIEIEASQIDIGPIVLGTIIRLKTYMQALHQSSLGLLSKNNKVSKVLLYPNILMPCYNTKNSIIYLVAV